MLPPTGQRTPAILPGQRSFIICIVMLKPGAMGCMPALKDLVVVNKTLVIAPFVIDLAFCQLLNIAVVLNVHFFSFNEKKRTKEKSR